PNAGGGADRNWLAEVRNQGRTPANDPPATDGGFASLNQNPAPSGMVPAKGVAKPSALARVTISAPAARPIASPRANARCARPEPASRYGVTMASSAWA